MKNWIECSKKAWQNKLQSGPRKSVNALVAPYLLYDDHPHSQVDQLRQSFHLSVGKCDATIGPVKSVLYGRVAVAETMNADFSTEWRFLWRHIAATRCVKYRIVI